MPTVVVAPFGTALSGSGKEKPVWAMMSAKVVRDCLTLVSKTKSASKELFGACLSSCSHRSAGIKGKSIMPPATFDLLYTPYHGNFSTAQLSAASAAESIWWL